MKNRKDLINETGNTYGSLTVKYYTKDKNGRGAWFCECSCGKTTIARGPDLRSGKIISCGCSKIKRCKEKSIDITNKIFNNLQAIKYEYSTSSRQYWSFKCLLCGNIVIKNKESVMIGSTTNCGCISNNLNSYNNRAKIPVGQVFGLQKVIKEITKPEERGPTIVLCECIKCGIQSERILTQLKYQKEASCKCCLSYQEIKIESFLIENNIPYKSQYTYSDLLSKKGNRLRFDFALLNENNKAIGLIEYQGIQHFDDSHGDFGRQQREVTDQQKVEYCLKNKIPLLILTKENDLEKDIVNFYNEVI